MRYEIVQLVPRQAGWQQEEEEAAAAEASGSGNWRGETSNSVREVSWRQPSPFIRANLPIPRDNHNCTTAGDNLFVNQTHSLRQPAPVIRGSWRQPAPVMRGTVPTPGDIHSSTTVGDNLFVQQTHSRRQSAPVIRGTIPAASSWRQPSPVIRGPLPTPRDSHNCTTAGDNIFVQRRTHSRRQSTPVVRGTAPVTHSWRQPTPVTGDTLQTPRDNHSYTTGGDYLFASRGTDDTNPLKDLHII
ncbi:uncharacterized protein [Pyrus communis]|uniref:uncharacterized protein n=1 Tax=Pyrus communis TaxID=23211 RepID=UPI0035C09950